MSEREDSVAGDVVAQQVVLRPGCQDHLTAINDGREALRALALQAERYREALRETAKRVHLVLNDYFSGMAEERQAAHPAYGWLSNIYEAGEDNINDVETILARLAAAETPEEPAW